ncbi:MAG: putative DNA binding domain-containing protein [Anaerolineales bacterium]|nr:MAG: putative DNA binding domain-containing protein [Anaerolineales bacterium]
MSNKRRSGRGARQWRRVDLHLHTPGSTDFAESDVTYLDILQKAESSGLDIIAFTDHNTVVGYGAMQKEIEELRLLKQLNRLRADERRRLDEYQRLLSKILVLPGFELTATLGFHVLGIFPPHTTVRELEYILLRLNVPPDKLDRGSTEVGATVDVLTAYRIINEAGGLVIAPHANSSHGVALRGFDFGGQTKIAYTQDPHLHALEVTDLESKSRRRTALFFNGTKPEYPRRMHCIQGSDSHHLSGDPKDKNRLGVGGRVTEVLLSEASFEALLEVFEGDDFARTRPFRPTEAPFDHVQAAREQGASIVQSFHKTMVRRGGRLHAIICDVCAFANTNGGNIYIGVSPNPKSPPAGLDNPTEAISALKVEIERKITPPLSVSIDTFESQERKVLRVTVSTGDDPPYAVDENKIYVRDESETNIAVRDEIVGLVAKKHKLAEPLSPVEEAVEETAPANGQVAPPRTGVEIVIVEERKGNRYYSMKDLRNGNVVHNVTQQSARKLWQYAITQSLKQAVKPENVQWKGDIGLLKRLKRAGKWRYDFVQRDADGTIHVYYGVTEDGIHGPWRQFVQE